MLTRKQRLKATLTVRAQIYKSARNWLDQQGFVEVQGPIIIPANGEKPNHFKVDFFGQPAYLSGSLQPYSDTYLSMFNKIYTVAPTFRAEPFKSKRHLAEYWRVEVLSKCHFEEMLCIQEQMLAYICCALAKECAGELRLLGRQIESLQQIKVPFPRLTYDEAIERLQKEGCKIYWGQPLDHKNEIKLSQTFTQPFFMTHLPLNGETIFHKPVPNKSELTLSSDLIAPEGYGEIAGSSELITQKKQISNRLAEIEIEPKERCWYLGLKKNKSSPQSVSALGFEGLLRWLCKKQEIAETTVFPRRFKEEYY